MENTNPPCWSCQSDSLVSSTRQIPKPLDLAYRANKYREQNGFWRTVGKLGRYLQTGRLKTKSEPALATAASHAENEVLELRPGELVEVRSEAEIARTLDDHGKLRGLAFLEPMRSFCGKQFTVLKRVERIYLEESGTTRRMKNTVLLNNVMCDGLLMGCDRSCFFYWREAWLNRVCSKSSA